MLRMKEEKDVKMKEEESERTHSIRIDMRLMYTEGKLNVSK
jgi:hypothetical protein